MKTIEKKDKFENVEQAAKIYESIIKWKIHNMTKIEDYQQRLFSNFTQEMPWVLESLYQLHKQNAIIRQMENYTEDNNSPELQMDALNSIYKYLSSEVKRTYNVRSSSTGEMFRVSSTWDYVEMMKFVEHMDSLAFNYKHFKK